MPAKAPIDENVKFLFACLIRSDYKTIDFTRVAADFSINPAAARMRWSRLKKTINVDNIAASILDGKKRRMNKPRPSLPSVKVEKVEGDASQPPPAASAVGIMLKEEGEAVSPEGLAPELFAGLPKPPSCKGAGTEEQAAIPVADEAAGAVGRFAATQVPHLPRVTEAAVVEAPETKPQSPMPQKPPPGPEVQVSPILKPEPKAQLEKREEEGKAMMFEPPPPTDAMRENTGNTVMLVLTANGSKKRKMESM
ncbi:hypothetical protein C7212DRAFT_366600 [Tuber magnatum]|uniref:Myb-like DNA-binding domain-containing protein n=1 Tax=Tuber magnatum TaxID=42249 RepID=A0A317SFX5_9PEZI|nr:hypothetical protein C7212DRAFT_366600 [Tuber magnatum]